MFAYQISIELIDRKPRFLRKVIVPSGMTFKKLHEIIHTVWNFQIHDIKKNEMVYTFNLDDCNLILTNDNEAFKENSVPNDLASLLKYIQELEKNPIDSLFALYSQSHHVKKPGYVKIDYFLEECLSFNYNFNEWIFEICLEKEVNDYPQMYPMLVNKNSELSEQDIQSINSKLQLVSIKQKKR